MSNVEKRMSEAFKRIAAREKLEKDLIAGKIKCKAVQGRDG